MMMISVTPIRRFCRRRSLRFSFVLLVIVTGTFLVLSITERTAENENLAVRVDERTESETRIAFMTTATKSTAEIEKLGIGKRKESENHIVFSTTKKSTAENGSLQEGETDENQNHIVVRMKLEGYADQRFAKFSDFVVNRFKNCIASICEHTSINLTLHIISDEIGKHAVMDIVNNVQKMCKKELRVLYYNHDEIVQRVLPQIEEIKEATQNSHGMKHRHPLFFFVLVLDAILPKNLQRVISVDVDFFFQSDIKELFDHFQNFQPTTIFGMAREQNPLYRGNFEKYRASHPGTKLGEPGPDGVTGFNGGLALVNLNHMRDSQVYKQLLRDNALKTYSERYEFKGSWAEQDCLVLLHMEHPELFYVVPCSWNRQVCAMGGKRVFMAYHNCPAPIHAYHGNCKLKMPNEH